MEKIKVEKRLVEKTKHIHLFYCDKCGAFIDSSEEDEDGRCVKIGEYIRCADGLAYKATLCKECAAAFSDTLHAKLLELGFK